MEKIINISSEPYQRHVVLFEESEIILELRYLPPVQIWIMNVEYSSFILRGTKLICGPLHMQSANQPFDFIVSDNTGNGLDPFRLGDFEDGRSSLYILNSDDMEAIRGVSV